MSINKSTQFVWQFRQFGEGNEKAGNEFHHFPLTSSSSRGVVVIKVLIISLTAHLSLREEKMSFCFSKLVVISRLILMRSSERRRRTLNSIAYRVLNICCPSHCDNFIDRNITPVCVRSLLCFDQELTFKFMLLQ